jgi:leucyl aminopeptidase
MRIETSTEHFSQCAGEVLVLPVFQAGSLPSVTADAAGATGLDLASITTRYRLRNPGDHCWLPVSGGVDCPDLLLVCVGERNGDGVDPDDLRVAAMHAARQLDRAVVVCLLGHVDTPRLDATRIVVEATTIGAYSFDRYRTTSDHGAKGIQRLVLPGADAESARVGEVFGQATNFARDLTNTPAGDLTPAAFAGICESKAGEVGLAYRDLDVTRLAAEGFGGILGVGAGSSNPPVLVCLESGDDSGPATALIGKGITFDAGGLAVKHPLNAMANMKCDMGGAAAVLAAMVAATSLGIDSHLRAYLPLAENAVGPNSQRPGDVLRHRGGRTCEVVNPDSEGRLILADAIAYATEADPAQIVDVATLTGATGLGPEVWGIMGTSQPLVDALLRAGRDSGDPGWQLPLWEGYRKNLRSEVADLRNHQLSMSQFWNHKAIWAGLYLREFAASTPWAHLDVAATVFRNEPDETWAAGATGTGTRALVEFLRTGGTADA